MCFNASKISKKVETETEVEVEKVVIVVKLSGFS